MSLLLDALKRAEQEKLARVQGEPAGSPPPRESAAVRATAPPPPGAFELQPLSSGAPAHTLGATPRPDAGVHAAQVVFQAKAGNAPEPRSRGMLWATIGAIAVVAIAAGAYVWQSVRALTPQAVGQVRPRVAPIPPPAGAPPMQQPAAEAALLSPAGPQSATPDPAPKPAAAAPAPRSPEDAMARLLRQAAAVPATAPPMLDRSVQSPRQVPAEVSAGYAALRQGNLATARRSYEQAIAADPANLDAHLGLATIDARAGNRSSSAAHYRRALDLDPRNATALAGLASLADFARPEALETQLRADLARSPDSPALRFTLGNLYASQGRWREAQAEYFEAHRLDPGSGDTLYNLAISLDKLGQSRLAASFYRRALEAARDQGAQFDPAPVARRLAEIR